MTSRTLFLLSVVLAAACGKHPVTPTSPSGSSPTLSQQIESASYSFRYAPGDSVNAAWQETFHDWAIAALDVQPPRRVTYNKFLSRVHMGDLTGHYDTNGYADPTASTIYTIWPNDNHEVIHVYSALFGSPAALFNEGFAVAHQTDPARGDLTPRWNGMALHDWARMFRGQGRLIGLAALLVSNDFRQFDANVTYPESGSFVKYLLETHGLDAMKRFFRGGAPLDSAAATRTRFESSFGRAIEESERDWWAMLDGR